MRSISYGVFHIMVSSQSFQATILRYLDLHDTLQRMNIVVRLSRFNSYYIYRCF